jgi:hypothetical protein
VEQELAAGLGERQITKFVEDDEVHASEVIGKPPLPSIAGLGLEPVDEVDDIVEPAARARSDAASGDGDAEMGLAGARSNSSASASLPVMLASPRDSYSTLDRLIGRRLPAQ